MAASQLKHQQHGVQWSTRHATGASTAGTNSTVASTDPSPMFYKYVDPAIDQALTPLTSADTTPEPEKKVATAIPAASTTLNALKARVDEACFSRNTQVEAWGHRGASAAYPDNTMASFRAACKDGAQGIETDIHITSDNVLVMFHDPSLDNKTNGSGKIHETPWAGVLEHVRTKAQPPQPLPKFSEVLALLMEPENIHVKLNIDCKVENIPEKLFPMIKEEMIKFDGWKDLLAPRIVLGIWHPKFIAPAKRHLPFIPLFAICMSLPTIRSYFFRYCNGFSIYFPALFSGDGKQFREECAKAGKQITVWTVNDRNEMLECIRWGVRAVITDVPRNMVKLTEEIEQNPSTLIDTYFSRLILPWSSPRYYSFRYNAEADEERVYLEREGGGFSAAVNDIPDDITI